MTMQRGCVRWTMSLSRLWGWAPRRLLTPLGALKGSWGGRRGSGGRRIDVSTWQLRGGRWGGLGASSSSDASWCTEGAFSEGEGQARNWGGTCGDLVNPLQGMMLGRAGRLFVRERILRSTAPSLVAQATQHPANACLLTESGGVPTAWSSHTHIAHPPTPTQHAAPPSPYTNCVDTGMNSWQPPVLPSRAARTEATCF